MSTMHRITIERLPVYAKTRQLEPKKLEIEKRELKHYIG